jgi:hypothetical protein
MAKQEEEDFQRGQTLILWKNLYHVVAVNPQNITEIGAAGY